MEMTIHRLDNPTPHQQAKCSCGQWETSYLTLGGWKIHIAVATAGKERTIVRENR